MKYKISLIIFVSLSVLLAFSSTLRNIISDKYDKTFKRTSVSRQESDCNYSLENFDFHFKQDNEKSPILMFGNSHMRNGDWAKLLGRNDVMNRGIAGDILPCMCKRMKYLDQTQAKIYFIEAGINDLPYASESEVLENYRILIDRVRSKQAIPVVTLIFYLSPIVGNKYPYRSDYKSINKMISNINASLIAMCDKAEIDYIDLNTSIADSENTLMEQYTSDGIHLSAIGYAEWAKRMKLILAKNHI